MTRESSYFQPQQAGDDLAQRRHEFERKMILTVLGRERTTWLSCGMILAAIVREGATWLRNELGTPHGDQYAWQTVQEHLNQLVAAGELVLEIQPRPGKDGRNHDTRVYRLARRPYA